MRREMGKELKSRSKYTFSPEWLHEPRQKATLLSRFVTPPGTKEGNFPFWHSRAKSPFSPGWYHQPWQKIPLLSRLVTRPGTKGVSIYKSSDPPPPALSHFFVPDPPPSLSCPPPPPPPSSSLTAAFRGAPRPLPHGILHRHRPPEIRRCPRPLPRRRSAAVGPRNAGGFLPDLPRPPRPPGLRCRRAVLLLRAVLPSPRGSTAAVPSSSSALSSPASGAPPSPPALPPAVLSIVASSCTVVLPNATGSALPGHRSCPGSQLSSQIGSCWRKQINCLRQHFLISFKELI
jgi:hypothetical protein